MAKTATADAPVPSMPDASPPGLYRASWLDRLMAAMEGLPVPYWLTYLILGLASGVEGTGASAVAVLAILTPQLQGPAAKPPRTHPLTKMQRILIPCLRGVNCRSDGLLRP